MKYLLPWKEVLTLLGGTSWARECLNSKESFNIVLNARNWYAVDCAVAYSALPIWLTIYSDLHSAKSEVDRWIVDSGEYSFIEEKDVGRWMEKLRVLI
jgi:hypothetical protein